MPSHARRPNRSSSRDPQRRAPGTRAHGSAGDLGRGVGIPIRPDRLHAPRAASVGSVCASVADSRSQRLRFQGPRRGTILGDHPGECAGGLFASCDWCALDRRASTRLGSSRRTRARDGAAHRPYESVACGVVLSGGGAGRHRVARRRAERLLRVSRRRARRRVYDRRSVSAQSRTARARAVMSTRTISGAEIQITMELNLRALAEA